VNTGSKRASGGHTGAQSVNRHRSLTRILAEPAPKADQDLTGISRWGSGGCCILPW